MKYLYTVMVVAVLLLEPLSARIVPKKESKRQFVLLGSLLGEALAPLFGAALGSAALSTGQLLNNLQPHIYQPVQVHNIVQQPVQVQLTPKPTPDVSCPRLLCVDVCPPIDFEEVDFLTCPNNMKCCRPDPDLTTTTTMVYGK